MGEVFRVLGLNRIPVRHFFSSGIFFFERRDVEFCSEQFWTQKNERSKMRSELPDPEGQPSQTDIAVSTSPYRVSRSQSRISGAISNNSYDCKDVQELFTHHCKEEQFSGESLEKENDEVTKTYQRMTNSKDILGVSRSEKRGEMARRNQAVQW